MVIKRDHEKTVYVGGGRPCTGKNTLRESLNLIVFAHMYNQSPSLLVILLGRPA